MYFRNFEKGYYDLKNDGNEKLVTDLMTRVKVREKVIDEMMYFHQKLNVSNFIFRDPVFSLNRNHTIELCEKLINSKMKV